MTRLATLVAAAVFLCILSAEAESTEDCWPIWRGSDSTGVAPKANPPLEWSETKNIKWKRKTIGYGSSTPIIWADKIFYLTAIKTDKKVASVPNAQPRMEGRSGGRAGGRSFRGGGAPTNVYKFDVVCLDRNTGDTLWRKTACEAVPHEGHHSTGNYASYSPLTDGDHVWASFGSRGVHCYDLEGNHKWSRDLGKLQIKMSFGEGATPALAGDVLIVVMDHEGDSAVYAIDKLTGEVLWKKPRDENTSWSTPLVVTVGGKQQAIVSATGAIRAYDIKTGDVVWQCSGMTGNVIPHPVAGFGMVFCASGFRGNAMLAIELGRTGNLTGSDAVKWQVKEATPYVPSPILYGDKIYVCSTNRAVISCYNAKTGKLNFLKQPLDAVGDIYASPVGAADRIYFAGRSGTTQVIRNSETFEILATNVLEDEIDASPVIVGDEIFLKGKNNLYCIAAG
ncbi:MAG: PQQ-like beta-propeller repeat protein [Sedimentisphaerales bacterium]|nr:PQQ-like beta-propeller repeat protein [Sedimentisphaerales bacterium]